MFSSLQQAWDDAVARNASALTEIVASLLAMLAFHGGTGATRIPRALHATILRVLRPAESALRRLIVIAARDLMAAPEPPASPKASAARAAPHPRKPPARAAFRLFDPRKRFGQRRITYTSLIPRVSFIAPAPPLIPLFQKPEAAPPPAPEPHIGARRLCLRIKALGAALEDLPRPAQRLVRLRARQERKPTFLTPLRPGRPPGHRKIPRLDVDFVLAECHAFALGVLAEPQPDTS